MRIFIRLVFWAALLGLGWIFGAKWGAPPVVLDTFDQVTRLGADKAREVVGDVSDELEEVDFGEVAGELADGLKQTAGDTAEDLRQRADELALQFDEANDIPEEVEEELQQAPAPVTPEPVTPAPSDETPEAAPSSAPAASAALQRSDQGEGMKLCLTNISNAPPADSDGNIRNFKKLINVDGVAMLLAPVTKSCLSSGYGPRGSSGRVHRGVDYHTQNNGEVLAAADGVILEAAYRDDYGYMIVIDHGNGVYTRYAHLQRFESGVSAGRSVRRGGVMGPIGKSGAYTSVVHLHFEILRGDYNTPKKSFGLTAADPYKFPAAR